MDEPTYQGHEAKGVWGLSGGHFSTNIKFQPFSQSVAEILGLSVLGTRLLWVREMHRYHAVKRLEFKKSLLIFRIVMLYTEIPRQGGWSKAVELSLGRAWGTSVKLRRFCEGLRTLYEGLKRLRPQRFQVHQQRGKVSSPRPFPLPLPQVWRQVAPIWGQQK